MSDERREPHAATVLRERVLEKRSLTPRELEVLALVAYGYRTSEIAQRLWISEETVRTHLRRLMGRLGARTRAHAVAIAFREGLWASGHAGRGGSQA